MPEFLNVVPPERALRILLEQLEPVLAREAIKISTAEALGEVTAEAVYAPEDLPSFPRSTMDGFSVRASDTFGASEGLPAYLNVVGEVAMGRATGVTLGVGETAVTYTGGMLAGGADAVVMVEQTQTVDQGTIEVLRPVAPGENMVQVGEDVKSGELVLPAGQLLRPQDLGGLMALGVTFVKVARRPRVAIVSMGDEVVPPHATPAAGQIRDVNTYTVAGLVRQAGGIAQPMGIVPDDYDQQLGAAKQALAEADVVVLSAGSSLSARDLTARVIENLGRPGVLVHGLSLRPGKPAIVGLVDGKPAFGLPGNPVSAIVVFDLLVRPTLYHLRGCVQPPKPDTANARLSHEISSAPGREDHVPVRLGEEDGQRIAHPVFGKSNLIYTLIRADGLVRVPPDRSGLYSGEEVLVRLFQG